MDRWCDNKKMKTLTSNSLSSTPLLLCIWQGLRVDFYRERSGSTPKPVSACSKLRFPRKPPHGAEDQDGWGCSQCKRYRRVWCDYLHVSFCVLISCQHWTWENSHEHCMASNPPCRRDAGLWGLYIIHLITHSGSGKPFLPGPGEWSCLWYCSIEMWICHLRLSMHGVVCLGVKKKKKKQTEIV